MWGAMSSRRMPRPMWCAVSDSSTTWRKSAISSCAIPTAPPYL
ncbi:hypothetical protein EVA_09648 [gut metagenome]|uniref:Uncharacterized protein n=1 Tax=gut metagenome TaxID=749906 RepID=J9GJN0_9ZZZZ